MAQLILSVIVMYAVVASAAWWGLKKREAQTKGADQ